MDDYQIDLLAQSLNLNPLVLRIIYQRYKPQTVEQLVQIAQTTAQSAQSLAVNFNQAFQQGYRFRPRSMNDLAGQCFTAGHLVEIEGGLYREIQELNIGDLVLASDGKTLNKVVTIIKRVSPVVGLKTSLANFEVTREHPFLTSKGFIEAQSLNKDSDIVIPATTHKPSGLTDSELKWLGFWLGDGDVHKEYKGNSVVFRLTVSQKKSEFVESLNIGSSKHPHSSHKTTSIHILQKRKHKLLAMLLQQCFDENKQKQLPLVFSKSEYQKIIEGYLIADGYLTKKGCYEVNSVSKKLLFSVQKASLLSGYHLTTINLHKRESKNILINGKKVRRIKPIYRMYVDLTKEGVQFSKPVGLEDNGNAIVYNITVDGDNTYICNNHAVHNCGWFAQQVTRLADGSTWTIGNSIQEKINNLQRHRMNGNAFLRGEAPPEVGQSIILKTNGKYGHVAVINEVLPDGRLKLTESNWNNDLAVTHDRIIDQNDQDIVGFLRTKPTGEFNRVPSQTHPLTPTTPKTFVAQAPAPMDRQELPEEEQPVKVDDLRVGNSNAKRLQDTLKIDNQNIESIIKSKPANSLNEQIQSLQSFAQPKPTPQPTSLIKPFTQPNQIKPQMSMAPQPVSPIRKPPQISQPVKQFKPPQMSMAPKNMSTPKVAIKPNPVPKLTPKPPLRPQSQSKPVSQKKPIIKTVINKVKGYFA